MNIENEKQQIIALVTKSAQTLQSTLTETLDLILCKNAVLLDNMKRSIEEQFKLIQNKASSDQNNKDNL